MRSITRVLGLAGTVAVLGALIAWSPRGEQDDSRTARPCRDTGWKPVLLLADTGWKPVLREGVVLASAETDSCPVPAEDRGVLVPVAEAPGEPTLAPPEPRDGDLRGEVAIVRVEGELPAPDEALSPIAPIPDPQNEPALVPPEPVPGGASPLTITVRVEAEQAAGEDIPTDARPRERLRVGGS